MKNLYYRMIVVLCIVVLTCLTGAVSFAGQAPPYHDYSKPVQIHWPDITFNVGRISQLGGINVQAQGKGLYEPILAGDQVEISCDYYIVGCYQKRSFTNRVEINNMLFEEKEADWVPPVLTRPDCNPEYIVSSRYKPDKLWSATAGNNTIKCILDSKNDIAEGPQNERNNTTSITVNIPWPAIDKIKDMKTKPPF